jgi:hypothetical protein
LYEPPFSFQNGKVYLLFFSRWLKALPAADLEFLPVRLSLKTLLAFRATLLLVTFLAIFILLRKVSF